MRRYQLLALAFTLFSSVFASAQSQQPPATPAAAGTTAVSPAATEGAAIKNTRLTPGQQKLKTFRTMFVRSDTVYLENDVLRTALMKRFEFHAWKVAMSEKDTADVWITVTRPFFTFDWRYRMTDPSTSRELAAGRIVAWDGKRAADGIAADIARAIGRLRPLPTHLLAGLGDEPNARKWELTYEKGSEGPRHGLRLTLSVSPERIVGRRQGRVLFVIPAKSVSGVGYNPRSTDASKSWDAFWQSFLGSVGDDPNSAAGALMLIPVALGGEALLKQFKREEHFCEIAWIEDGALRNIILKGDSRQNVQAFLAAIEEASHRKAVDLEAETADVREAIEREDREGHSIPLHLDKKIAVGWKILEPGAYRIVVLQRQADRAVAYFVSAPTGFVPGTAITVAAQMPVTLEPRTLEAQQSPVRYRETNGIVSLEEAVAGDKTLRFRAIPLRFAAEPQVSGDMEELLAEAALRPAYRSIHVKSDTVYLKREAMERALAQHPAFIQWELKVVPRATEAELALLVTRPFLTFDWTYSLTEVQTGKKVTDGKITARDGGRAATLIADQLVNALKASAAQQIKSEME